MEPRSRETTPTKEDLEFIVDDGYRHNEDPDYIPNEKIIIKGPEFKRLTRNAKKLGVKKTKKAAPSKRRVRSDGVLSEENE